MHNVWHLLANHCKCQIPHQQGISHGLFRHRMRQRVEIDIEEWEDASIDIQYNWALEHSLFAALGRSGSAHTW